MTDVRRRSLRTLACGLALLTVLAVSGCGDDVKPRDAGSGDGSGYGLPQK